jgi:putative transposase
LMPNHWHLLLKPYKDGDLSIFMRFLTLTHTQRWHAHYHKVGSVLVQVS